LGKLEFDQDVIARDRAAVPDDTRRPTVMERMISWRSKNPVLQKNYIWGENGLLTEKIRSADQTGERRFSCCGARDTLTGRLMGTRKNSDHPIHGTRWPAEKPNGNAQYGKRITSASNSATLITVQLINIAEEVNSGEVRPERIEFIRSLLDSDAYNIEPEEIAREMLGEIWQWFECEFSSRRVIH
jgi:hypothetical protein